MEETKCCEGENCPYQMEHNHKKWSWPHFMIGIVKDLKALVFSSEVWVFAIVTYAFFALMSTPTTGQWGAYIGLGAAFMFFKPLSGLISRGNLNVSANIGANINKTIGGDK